MTPTMSSDRSETQVPRYQPLSHTRWQCWTCWIAALPRLLTVARVSRRVSWSGQRLDAVRLELTDEIEASSLSPHLGGHLKLHQVAENGNTTYREINLHYAVGKVDAHYTHTN